MSACGVIIFISLLCLLSWRVTSSWLVYSLFSNFLRKWNDKYNYDSSISILHHIAKRFDQILDVVVYKYKTIHCFSYSLSLRPKLEYCCHLWAGAVQSSFFSLSRVQKHLYIHVGDKLFFNLQSLSHRRNVESLLLLCCLFHGNCSDQLYSLVP